MRKNSKLIILVLILFISIGFAYLSTNLFINGTSIVKGTTWDVHFNNIQNETSTSTIDSNATISSDSKSVDFEISFDKPGDSYSFNVDVVNNGNLDAMLESFDISGLRDDSSYLDWFVMYDDGVSLQKFDELKANSTEKLYITVIFDEDVDIDDLPTDYDTSFTMKFTANYVQADNNANTRESRTYNITYNLDGGTITNNPTTYNSRSGAVIPNPTKEGYTFAGWTGGKNILKKVYKNETTRQYYVVLSGDLDLEDNADYTISFEGVNGNLLYTNEHIFNSRGIWSQNFRTGQCVTTKTINYSEDGIYQNNHLILLKNMNAQEIANTFENVQIERGCGYTGYEPYISEPVTDILISPGMAGNRTYVANWEAI